MIRVKSTLAVLGAATLLGTSGLAQAGATLDAVKSKGFVQCGVSDGLPGFSYTDAKGQYKGIDVDICRAVAAAVFGDADKVKFSPLTAKERSRPELINAKRKIRIAKGSGTTVQEVNKLLKMHQEMSTAMKRLKKMGGFSKLAAMFGGGGGLGGAGGLPDLGGAGGAGGLPGLGGSAPFNMPPGFDKFSKK